MKSSQGIYLIKCQTLSAYMSDYLHLYKRLPRWKNRLVKRFRITYVSGDIAYISDKDVSLDRIDSLTEKGLNI